MSALAQILPHAGKAWCPTILVTEDEVLVRGVVADHLRDAGFAVIEASNAAEAVDVLQSGEPVDLVFTDIAMPGIMNGAMLARWIYLNRPDVRVVLASGSADSAQTFPDGRLFLKPYDLDDVESHIRRALGWA
ncbi:MAG TPA: response regulator [Rhizomicrobium sp.]|nr:response regulator [Rhizomicrobium sp.]